MNVLILGGSGGIGREVIRSFCQTKGNFIYYTYTSWTDKLAELNQYIIDSGNTPTAIRFIIGDDTYGDWKKDLEYSLPVLPEIDYFINSIGTLRDRTVAKMTDDELYDVINVNLLGTINACRIVLPHMRENGCIINFSSMVAKTCEFGQSNYASAKAGIITFGKCLAKELVKRKIRVVTISPSLVDTDIFNNLTNEQKQLLINRTLLKRMATPKEIADLVYFVCTLGTYFNGDCIEVSGGFT